MNCFNEIVLIPGNGGRDCPGNGSRRDENGQPIECQCDECAYMLICIETDTEVR